MQTTTPFFIHFLIEIIIAYSQLIEEKILSKHFYGNHKNLINS